MNIAYLNSNDFSFFSDAQEQLDQLIEHIQSEPHANSEHGDIERFINKKGQEILRCLLQGWLAGFKVMFSNNQSNYKKTI